MLYEWTLVVVFFALHCEEIGTDCEKVGTDCEIRTGCKEVGLTEYDYME